MLPLRWRFVMGTSWAKCRIVLPMNQKWFHDFCAPPQQGHGKNVKEIYDASMKVVLFPCCTLVVKYDRCQGLSQQPVVKVEVRPSFWSELLKQCSIWMDSCLEYQQLQDFAFLLQKGWRAMRMKTCEQNHDVLGPRRNPNHVGKYIDQSQWLCIQNLQKFRRTYLLATLIDLVY